MEYWNELCARGIIILAPLALYIILWNIVGMYTITYYALWRKERRQKFEFLYLRKSWNIITEIIGNQSNQLEKNKFNSTSVVDGHIGNTNIANHFKDKFESLFNSVPSSKESIASIYDCIESNVNNECNFCVDGIANHCHVISKDDVQKAMKKLKSDKMNGDEWWMRYPSV